MLSRYFLRIDLLYLPKSPSSNLIPSGRLLYYIILYYIILYYAALYFKLRLPKSVFGLYRARSNVLAREVRRGRSVTVLSRYKTEVSLGVGRRWWIQIDMKITIQTSNPASARAEVYIMYWPNTLWGANGNLLFFDAGLRRDLFLSLYNAALTYEDEERL